MKRNIVRMVWSSAEGCFALLLLLMFTRVQEGQAITTGNTVDICTTCHANATCDKKTDGSGGMVCNCKYGFLGNGRTQCHDKDECQIGATDICGEHTACYNTYGSFYCTCLDGYSPSNRMASFIPNDGTYCDDIDECQVSGICREGGLCKNLPGAFNCTCAEGYTVTNASEPFNPVKDAAFCKAVDCGPPPIIPHAYLLSETGTSYGNVVKYSCFQGYVLKSGNDTTVCNAGGEWEEPSLVCEDIDECQVRGICGEGGLCKNLPGDFNCTCAEGYTVTNASEPFNPVKDAAFCKAITTGNTVEICTTCHVNATCDKKTDGSGGMVCNCKYGFLGNGRTQCHDKDECQIGATDICGEHTACYNTYGSFYCTCLDGYSPSNRMASFIPNDGTYCDDIDECQVSGICREGGLCKNLPGAFNCTCAEGYTVTNASEPFNPVKDAAFCKAVDCGPPPIIPHAYLLSETGTSYGNVVKYSCFQGYVLKSGNDTTVCNAGGEWEEPSLVCEDIDECQVRGICGEGGLCKNLPGDFNCTCAEGYTVTNASEPFNPVKDAAFCKEIDCGQPPMLPHSAMLWNSSAGLGSVVYYNCKEGFYRAGGRNFSVCTKSGYWENASLLCKEIDCGQPPMLPHTAMLWNSSAGLGSVVYYNCKEGFYRAGGRNFSVCTKSGYWENASLLCKEIDCGQPPMLPHTAMLWNSSAGLGSVVYYNCKEGFYRAGGRNYSVCTINGYWENASLLCKEIDCGQPPMLPHTAMLWNSSAGLGSVVHYNCKEGFYRAGGRNFSVCTKSGYWENASLLCKEIDCGQPPMLPHTAMLWNSSAGLGSMVHYKCKEGFYRAGGRNYSVCTINGYWEDASLLCKEIDCGQPPMLPHTAMLWNSSAGLGSVVHYNCKEGFYRAGGRNYSVCTINGYWENASLLCKEINCGAPALVPHTDILWDKTAHLGSVVYFKCKEGFFVERGKNRSVCTANGFWETVTLTCKEINCGIPPPVQYTDMLWDNTSQLGSVVYYKCKEGFYTEEGKNYSVCTANRRWENITLKCKELDCGSPPVLAYTEMLQPNTTSPGSVVYYQCIDGFTSKGGRNVSVCTKRGEWDAATLICKEIPAISELSFKEGCLKWRAHRDDRLKETYNFKLDGLRGYQKDFLDKRIINFTSGDDTPEICLNLQPGTNYTINITALSVGYSIRAIITTSITDPPVPQVAFIVAEGPLPPLRLLRAAETNGPISLYQVVVLPMDGPLVFNCSSLNMPNFYSKKGGGGAYVTAELYAEDIADELVFNVGDRQYYGDYYNAPLEEGRGYNVILRVVSEWCQVRKQSCVNWAQTKGLSHTIQHVTILAGGSVGVIGFILFLCFSIVWCCKKRQDT
ncbi:sushi domain-containing protein 1-like isoform X2 [Acipenser ruthenus]|uniref:sushi domain-containing protein 1-like isoform X2 n=1 Tax=Acipenser ruthenus TaxID=7906 RepID=UPI00274233F2|nr:sushi domain-containing protein 1-like isoform X2 [Acipenser ruthenus]